MKVGLKHFLIVGVAFALVGGWLLSLIVNSAVGFVIGLLIGAPATSSYLGSLSLTLISVTLIGGASLVGNRVFRKQTGVAALPASPLLFSTLVFSCVVLGFSAREFSALLDTYVNNTSYFYQHGSELLKAASLPLARLLVIPCLYFLAARLTFPRSGV
ncbi:MAG: hypothetical protein WCC53_16355 [Thermoanaerobaculia bacterium]